MKWSAKLAITFLMLSFGGAKAAYTPQLTDVGSVQTLQGWTLSTMQSYPNVDALNYHSSGPPDNGGGIFNFQTWASGAPIPDGNIIIAPSDHSGTCTFGCMVKKLNSGTTVPDDYGTRGDGTTDDTAALTTALGSPYALAGGCGENFFITSEIHITASSFTGKQINVCGASNMDGASSYQPRVEITPSPAVSGGPVIYIDGSAEAVENVKITGLTINMANMADSNSSIAWEIGFCWHCVFEQDNTINNGSNKVSWDLVTGTYWGSINNSTGNIVELNGTSLSNAVTTIDFKNDSFTQYKSNNAIGITVENGSLTGSVDAFVLTNTVGWTTFGVDIEVSSPGHMWNFGSGTKCVESFNNNVEGFSGTYVTGLSDVAGCGTGGPAYVLLDPITPAPVSGASGFFFSPMASFTPVLNVGRSPTGITYGAQYGACRVIADQVNCDIEIGLTSAGSGIGNVTITGLPYTSSSALNQTMPIQINNLSSISGAVMGIISPGSSSITIYYEGTGSISNVTNSNLTSNSTFWLNFSYYL